MSGITAKNFDDADEVREPDKTRVEVINLGPATVARMTLDPGWRWSECIKPHVNTPNCQVHHIGVVLMGTLHVEHADGTSMDLEEGDAYNIDPEHEAWVVGDEPFMGLEMNPAAAQSYATDIPAGGPR